LQNHKFLLEKLLNEERKLRICFLVSESENWNAQILYDAMEKNEKFYPFVVVTKLINTKKCSFHDNLLFFKNRCKNVEIGFDEPSNSSIDIKTFKPDIVFYQQPLNISENQSPVHIMDCALSFYLPNGIDNISTYIKCNFVKLYLELQNHFIFNKKEKRNDIEMYYHKNSDMILHDKLNINNSYEEMNVIKSNILNGNDHLKNYAITLASGNGSRYKNSIPKQFAKISGKTVLEHTIEIFEKSEKVDIIIVVINPEYRALAESILLNNSYKKVRKLLNGGATRKESSYIGVSSIEEDEANVIIHDCARPFLTEEIINNCMKALSMYDAIDVAVPAVDTIIEVENNFIKSIPDRSRLMRGQTPQCFKLSIIKKAHELSRNDSNFTDDCSLVLKNKLGKVFIVEGDVNNIKITYPSDIYMADRLFQMKSILCPENISLEELRNKVIVIFGGTSGIGKCTASLAKKYGANVFITSKRLGCNISKYKDVEKYLRDIYTKLGRIDYVVNSAGILKIGKLVERNIEDIEEEIAVNYLGSINVVKASIPYLRESKGSMQLYTSSSYTRGRALYSTYSSTKAGIVNMVQALAEELYCQYIRINVINPERTATPMRFMAFGKEPEGSLLKPEKVAEKSLETLLTNLTGQVIDVRRIS